ncbi:MAG TPA: hypothetical protein VM409_06750 [Chloroflexia bacterium]|nr:hypothetical protein [Chloroflexia bacterium]
MKRLPGFGTRGSRPTLRAYTRPSGVSRLGAARLMRSGPRSGTRNSRLAFRLMRAASRLGVPGAIPGPPQLLPMGARVVAQGYLNRFAMPLLNGWLLPAWMREQTDPASPLFVPRSVVNLMVNQTARNWTALGLPGSAHPVESIVDRRGLLTPVPGGPSLDWWVQVEGGNLGLMSASAQPRVEQRLQNDLPVVLTAYEADGLRVSSEAWMLALEEGDWAAMQVVLFNIADMPLRGTFMFALRPYNSEGISPIYSIACDGETFHTRVARPGPITWPAPDGFAISDLAGGDIFSRGPSPGGAQVTSLRDPRGFAHGVLTYNFNIEPWEEAEFLAFMPVHSRTRGLPEDKSGFTVSLPSGTSLQPDPNLYSRAKAATTLRWQKLEEGTMQISLPQRDLQASWGANRSHILALHDGGSITPGPDLYHSFWFRDAAYMAHALSICGFRHQAEQVLQGFTSWQRRDGVFISHHGEWDSTGQALWAMCKHLTLYPDDNLKRKWTPALQRGTRWIAATLARSQDGLMPPGISSEHLGPPDRYYWDNLWSLAGLEEVSKLGSNTARRAAIHLRKALESAWASDQASLGGSEALVAAPGRNVDLGMIGTLAAWFPLDLLPPSSPHLEATLAALEQSTFYGEALFVGTGHSGWGTYLNMRVAGCRLRQGSARGWELMKWLLRHASPTLNWPEAIHPHSLGGSAGDGHHGWASAEWLMLVRALLLHETDDTLVITPAIPAEWLAEEGELSVRDAPTVFGPVSFCVRWDTGGRNLHLDIAPTWRKEPGHLEWKAPGMSSLILPPETTSAEMKHGQ